MTEPEPDTKALLTAADLALVQRQLDALADARSDGSIYEWAIASQLMDHIRAQDARIDDVREFLDWLYPSIAGRVIQLQKEGSENAAAHWNDIARRLVALRVQFGGGVMAPPRRFEGATDA